MSKEKCRNLATKFVFNKIGSWKKSHLIVSKNITLPSLEMNGCFTSKNVTRKHGTGIYSCVRGTDFKSYYFSNFIVFDFFWKFWFFFFENFDSIWKFRFFLKISIFWKISIFLQISIFSEKFDFFWKFWFFWKFRFFSEKFDENFEKII